METNQHLNNTSEGEAVVNPTAEVKQEAKPEVKTFTQEEVDAIVNKRLAKERRKVEEANKLAQMSAEERAEYNYQSKLAELSGREEELNKREAEYNQREMLTQTQKS